MVGSVPGITLTGGACEPDPSAPATALDSPAAQPPPEPEDSHSSTSGGTWT